MGRMPGKYQLSNPTTMHSHKQMLHGMVMVQQTALDMLAIRQLHQPHTIRDNRDTNRTHDNMIIICCSMHTLLL